MWESILSSCQSGFQTWRQVPVPAEPYSPALLKLFSPFSVSLALNLAASYDSLTYYGFHGLKGFLGFVFSLLKCLFFKLVCVAWGNVIVFESRCVRNLWGQIP